MFCSHYDGYPAYNISDDCGLSQSAVTVKACCEYHLFGVSQTVQSTVTSNLSSPWLSLSPGWDSHEGVWGL